MTSAGDSRARRARRAGTARRAAHDPERAVTIQSCGNTRCAQMTRPRRHSRWAPRRDSTCSARRRGLAGAAAREKSENGSSETVGFREPAASPRCPARRATRDLPRPTTCTAPTPAASGANASSSLGIMPPWTVPSAIAALASATVSRGMRDDGSSLSRRTPPTAVQATSAPAATAAGELAGHDVGVDVEDVPAGVRAQAGDHRQRVAAVERVQQRRGRSRRRRPRGRSRSARRPRPRPRAAGGGARGSRRSRPTCRTPGTPSARSAATRSTLTRPATIIFMTSSVGSSVTRRPPTMFGLDAQPLRQRGRLRAAAVHDQQPPPGARARAMSAATAASAAPSTTSPPSLMTASIATRHRDGLRPRPGSSSDAVSSRASGSCSGWPGRRRP